MLPILTAFAKAAAPYVLPAVAGAINQKNQNKAAMAAYNAQRAAEKADQASKFTDMAAAARRAGFNPLTVLRATGGAGYGGTNAVVPVMSKQNFAATFMSNAFGQYLTNKKNAPIDAYNEEIRKLELEQRRLDIKLARQTMATMTQKPNGLPKVPKNILDGYSLGMKNENLSTFGGNVTTNSGVTPTETGVDSRGSIYRKPAGEDFDEQLLNSVYHGYQQFRYGVIDAYNWWAKGKRPPDMPKITLNPNIPVIVNENNATPPFADPQWGNEHKKYQQTTKKPNLSSLNFGPNYRDRMSLDGWVYNY
jgi:hypothetical protein